MHAQVRELSGTVMPGRHRSAFEGLLRVYVCTCHVEWCMFSRLCVHVMQEMARVLLCVYSYELLAMYDACANRVVVFVCVDVCVYCVCSCVYLVCAYVRVFGVC